MVDTDQLEQSVLKVKEIAEHPKLRGAPNLLVGPKIDSNRKNKGSAQKLHFTPRRKYQSFQSKQSENAAMQSDEEEKPVPLTRLQKIEKLIEGELPRPKPNVAAINA